MIKVYNQLLPYFWINFALQWHHIIKLEAIHQFTRNHYDMYNARAYRFAYSLPNAVSNHCAKFNLKRFYGKFGSFKLDCALFISK